MILSTIAAEQSKTTEFTINTVEQLLDYCVTYPNAKIRYEKSNMILNIHCHASYLGAPKVKNHRTGHFFVGWLPQDKHPIKLNGHIHILTSLL